MKSWLIHFGVLAAFLLPGATPSVHAQLRTGCESYFSRLGANRAVQTHPRQLNAVTLRRHFSNFPDIGEADNRAFIALSKKANPGDGPTGALFIDIQNSLMKELNDSVVRDKDLVTALTNLHKSLLWQALSEDPELQKSLLGQYSDFKSVRLCFQRNDQRSDPEFRKRLDRLLQTTNELFEQELRSPGLVSIWSSEKRKVARAPSTWFLGGMGSTPDEAGLAARQARKQIQSNTPPPIQYFGDVRQTLSAAAAQSEAHRKEIIQFLRTVPGALTPTSTDGSGAQTLSAEAIEVIRKVAPESTTPDRFTASLQTDFEKAFGLRLSSDQALRLQNYLAEIDQFSPGIFIEKHQGVDLSQAQLGIISADIKGQNARNIEQTARALADTYGQDLSATIRAVRAGEVKATLHFEATKRSFDAAIEQTFPSQKGTSFFGDDGIFMPQRPLNDDDKKVFLTNLMAQAPPDSFRITFVPSIYEGPEAITPAMTPAMIPTELRSSLIVEAERLEKLLRRTMKGFVSREQLNETLIAIDFRPRERGPASVGVFLRTRSERSFSQDHVSLIREALAREGYTASFIDTP